MSYIHRSNLAAALRSAIKHESEAEQKLHGPTFESTMVTGWKQVLKDLEDGKWVVIK